MIDERDDWIERQRRARVLRIGKKEEEKEDKKNKKDLGMCPAGK